MRFEVILHSNEPLVLALMSLVYDYGNIYRDCAFYFLLVCHKKIDKDKN